MGDSLSYLDNLLKYPISQYVFQLAFVVFAYILVYF